MLGVIDACHQVCREANDVRIDPANCDKWAASLDPSGEPWANTWSTCELNPTAPTTQSVDWIFTVDTLHFSFWSDLPDGQRYTVAYRNKKWTGYWSLCAAINRALDEGIPITSPRYWIDELTMEKLDYVFRSETDEPIPLLADRFRVLREAGAALAQFEYSFAAVITRQRQSAGPSAQALVEWVVTNIPSYNDAPIYNGRRTPIYKRAQILVGDLWSCFRGTGWGEFNDIGTITAFADYRIPQILRAVGCLEYSSHLDDTISRREIIAPGSAYEVEIRAATVVAVENLVAALRRLRGPTASVNAVQIDHLLWLTSKSPHFRSPHDFHRTRSIYY